nr:MAG TPA: hypothetical protein [Caudoviricetes sp.]
MKQTCFYHQSLLNLLETAIYKRSFNSFAKSSNPGFPSKANIFFLFVNLDSLILLKKESHYIKVLSLN